MRKCACGAPATAVVGRRVQYVKDGPVTNEQLFVCKRCVFERVAAGWKIVGEAYDDRPYADRPPSLRKIWLPGDKL